MNALADALRALLTPDPHSGLRPSIGSPKIAAARAALAAHDAAVNAGGWQVDVAGWRVIVPRTDPHYCDRVVFDIATGLDDSDNVIHLANASRAVACVNACVGIADPAAMVAAARALDAAVSPDSILAAADALTEAFK